MSDHEVSHLLGQLQEARSGLDRAIHLLRLAKPYINMEIGNLERAGFPCKLEKALVKKIEEAVGLPF